MLHWSRGDIVMSGGRLCVGWTDGLMPLVSSRGAAYRTQVTVTDRRDQAMLGRSRVDTADRLPAHEAEVLGHCTPGLVAALATAISRAAATAEVEARWSAAAREYIPLLSPGCRMRGSRATT